LRADRCSSTVKTSCTLAPPNGTACAARCK
jgi:hypothetical protein